MPSRLAIKEKHLRRGEVLVQVALLIVSRSGVSLMAAFASR